ncbi:MAG: aminoacyl-tRNA hydrolase [Pseudomonadota bacterium]
MKKLWNALAWRFRGLVGDARLDRIIYMSGMAWRNRLTRPAFVTVVGSVGKTTAKDILVGIFIRKGEVVGNIQSLNLAPEIAKIVLRVRPWTRFCVAELGETGPNTLDSMLTLLRPAIAIVTNVGDDHISAFGSRDAIASELCKAVLAVPDSGTVVLNADDPRVAGMANGLKCRVMKFGLAESADIRARDVVCVWPDPLEFTVEYQSQTLLIKTQLYGRQLLTSALAAIGGGLAAGFTLEECAAGIQTVSPPEGRLQLVREAGVMFMRDDFKAPYWTLAPLIEQVAGAQVQRKIFVLGTITDANLSKEVAYVRVAEKLLEAADITIVVGRFASAVLKLRNPKNRDRLVTFSSIRDVRDFIYSIRREGDLIVLKGNGLRDHLDRIPMSFSGSVNCWVDDCDRPMFCRECSHLLSHRGLSLVDVSKIDAPQDFLAVSEQLPGLDMDEQVAIGLGNPGAEFDGTPHNVGYAMLDLLSNELSMEWQVYADAWIARGQVTLRDGSSRRCCLLKVNSPMNLIGSKLSRLADSMGFGAEQCILVYDDLDCPIGKIKLKMHGSSGGHRGVASVLEAFQTDKIRRIKIGVADGTATVARSEMVLRKFSAENLEKIKPAVQLAAKRLAELI